MTDRELLGIISGCIASGTLKDGGINDDFGPVQCVSFADEILSEIDRMTAVRLEYEAKRKAAKKAAESRVKYEQFECGECKQVKPYYCFEPVVVRTKAFGNIIQRSDSCIECQDLKVKTEVKDDGTA